jgi:hypothetical protein
VYGHCEWPTSRLPPTETKLPPNQIDLYQRVVSKVFAPTGHLASASSFLRMGNVLGIFEVA